MRNKLLIFIAAFLAILFGPISAYANADSENKNKDHMQNSCGKDAKCIERVKAHRADIERRFEIRLTEKCGEDVACRQKAKKEHKKT